MIDGVTKDKELIRQTKVNNTQYVQESQQKMGDILKRMKEIDEEKENLVEDLQRLAKDLK